MAVKKVEMTSPRREGHYRRHLPSARQNRRSQNCGAGSLHPADNAADRLSGTGGSLGLSDSNGTVVVGAVSEIDLHADANFGDLSARDDAFLQIGGTRPA